MPAEDVISCPACRHLLRVPADWLGTTVQCPQCQAKFRAPVRDGDRLTDPELISRPPAAAAAAGPKGDPALWLPAFGLMFVGVASVVVNGYLLALFLTAPDGGREWVKKQVSAVRQAGFLENEPEADDDRRAAELTPKFAWMWPAAMAVGVVVFAGGLSIARRRNYRLAQVGCVLAAVNAPHLCCLPGAVFGLWGLLMLTSDEGREHFRR